LSGPEPPHGFQHGQGLADQDMGLKFQATPKCYGNIRNIWNILGKILGNIRENDIM